MKIKDIKKEILSWKDFYGGDISEIDSIRKAKSKKELSEIIERHRRFMENMLADANNHLDEFKRSLSV
jgi:hypothetical protein